MLSTRLTLLLIAILIIPFCIKTKTEIEPFPAVILPAGANKVPVGATESNYTTTSLFAVNKEDTWSKLNTRELLKPLPSSFHNVIIFREFGLNTNNKKISEPGLLSAIIQFATRRKYKTEQEKAEVRKWLKSRLEAQNYDTSKIKIVNNQVTITIPNGDTLSSKIIHEKILYLD